MANTLFKCDECGCDKFAARQVVRLDVYVNGRGEYIENVTDEPYDSGVPYGPFECAVCGKEWDTLPIDRG
jgi:hypothetical protein